MTLLELEIKFCTLGIASYWRMRRGNYIFQTLNFILLMGNLYYAIYLDHFTFWEGWACGISGMALLALIYDLGKMRIDYDWDVYHKGFLEDMRKEWSKDMETK